MRLWALGAAILAVGVAYNLHPPKSAPIEPAPPGGWPTRYEQTWVKAAFGDDACSAVISVKNADPTDPEKLYVRCVEGTYYIVSGTNLFNFRAFPAYCTYDRPEGCWPMYCRAAGRPSGDTMNAEERRRCAHFPEVSKIDG